MTTPIFTIGYEGASLDDFIATLKITEVDIVVDIRELPISRRKGFAKTALSEALIANNIGYRHFKSLGDPKEGRDAARAGLYDKFKAIFTAHMKTEKALADLEKAVELVMENRICLLCYERDFKTCHRNIVSAELSDRTGMKITNLGVRYGAAKEIADNLSYVAA